MLRADLNFRLSLVLAVGLTALFADDASAQQSAEDAFGLAAGHYDREEYKQAIKGFRVLIQNHPDSPRSSVAYFFLGESLLQQRDYQAAYPAYQIYLRRRPSERYIDKSRLRMAECAFHLNWLDSAVTQLENFVDRYPKSGMNEIALTLLGEARLKRQEPQLAKRVFQRALQQFPTSNQTSRNRYGIAKALIASHDNDEAERFLDLMTTDRTSAWYGPATMQKGIVRYRQERFADASEFFQHAAEYSQDQNILLENRFWMAKSQMALERFNDAYKTFEGLLSQPISNQWKAAALFEGAVAASRAGNNDSALRWLNQLQQTWPESRRADDALQLEIEVLYQKREFDEALLQIKKFENEFYDHPRLSQIMDYRGRIQYDREQFQAAIRTYRNLLSRFGAAPEAERQSHQWRYLLGLAYLKQQDFAHALDVLGEIVPSDDNEQLSQNVLLASASAAAGMNESEQAVGYLQQFLAVTPTGGAADRARADLVVAHVLGQDWASADKQLDMLLENAGESSAVLKPALFVAEHALRNKRFSLAEKYFKVLSRSNHPRSYVVRGLSGLAWTRMTRGDEPSSVTVFEQLVSDFRETEYAGEAALACGRYFEENHDHTKAIEMFDLAASRFADTEVARVAKLREAYNRAQMGGERQLRLAQAILSEIIAAGGENQDTAHYQLAWVLLDSGDRPQSQFHFQEIADNFPHSLYWADATYRVAQDAQNEQNFSRARRYVDLLSSADMDPQVATRTKFLLGQLAVHDSDWEITRNHMAEVLKDTDEEQLRKKARYWLAESKFQQENYVVAASDFQRLIDSTNLITERRLAWAVLRRAQCHAFLSEWSQALKVALSGMKTFPAFEARHEFNYVVGRVHAAQGRLTDARLAFQRVIESSTGKSTQTAAMAQWRIGETYFHQEKYREAVQAFYKVDSLYSYPKWRAAALVEAAKCQEHLGNWRHAMKLYGQLIEKHPESELLVIAQQRLSTATRQATRLDEKTTK